MASAEYEKKVQDLESLLEVTQAMTVEKDLDKLLTFIISATTRVMNAERSSLYLYDEPAKEIWTKIAQGMSTREIRLPVGRGIAGTVAQTLETINISDAYQDARFDQEVDKRSGFRTRSILCMPMRNHEGRLIGVIQVLNKKDGAFGDYDETLLGAFSTHAAIALDQARLVAAYLDKQKLEQALEIARSIQQGLFPKEIPEVPGFDLAGWSQPADETGGDYYDFLQLPGGRLALVVGDVTGHGVGPALLMAEARAFIKAAVTSTNDIASLLYSVNNLLEKDMGGRRFITLFYGVLDPEARTFRYASAGHGHPILYRPGAGKFFEMESTGPPLGIMTDVEFPEGEAHQLEPGDVLVISTDGIEEAMDAERDEYGRARFKEVVARCFESSAQEIIDTIYRDVQVFCDGAPQRDDITLVVCKATD